MKLRFLVSVVGFLFFVAIAGVTLGLGLAWLVPVSDCSHYQMLEPPLSGHVAECLP